MLAVILQTTAQKFRRNCKKITPAWTDEKPVVQIEHTNSISCRGAEIGREGKTTKFSATWAHRTK